MNAAYVAIGISFCSLLIASLSLGWNIYRDVIRKPRLRVSIMNGVLAQINTGQKDRRVVISITNHGPGKTTAHILHLRKSSFWLWLSRRRSAAMLMHDYADKLSGELPAELDVGQKVHLTFRHSADIFLKEDYNQIGITDPFGKTHWCPKKEYAFAQQTYRENLPDGGTS